MRRSMMTVTGPVALSGLIIIVVIVASAARPPGEVGARLVAIVTIIITIVATR